MTGADLVFTILGSICVILGFIGCIIPGIPGTPLCWGGLLLASFVSRSFLDWKWLLGAGILTIAVEVLDNFIPSIFTKHGGGTKAGSIGSTIGVFAGLLVGGVWGILLGPFVGAFVGEMIYDHSDIKRALHSAWNSFLGFLTGTGLRLITSAIFVFLFVRSFF